MIDTGFPVDNVQDFIYKLKAFSGFWYGAGVIRGYDLT